MQYSSTNKLHVYIKYKCVFYYFDLSESSYTAPFLCLSSGTFLLVSTSGKEKNKIKICFLIKTYISISPNIYQYLQMCSYKFAQLKIRFQTFPISQSLYRVCGNIASKALNLWINTFSDVKNWDFFKLSHNAVGSAF